MTQKLRPFLGTFLISCFFITWGTTVYAMPPLIQTTTLEQDYENRVHLELMSTKKTDTENVELAFEHVLCSCVRIQADGYYGSGSIYRMNEDSIIIVGNRHVLQYFSEESLVTFFNNTSCKGSVLGISEDADIGFVLIETSELSWYDLLSYREVRVLNRDDRQRDYPYFAVDMANDSENPKKYSGTIASERQYLDDFHMAMIYGHGFAKPGMSGCGVFDYYGQYLGMLTAGTTDDEIAAVPFDKIEEEYQKILDTQKTSP